MKAHLLRLAAPKTWLINRKERTFITRPKPGAQPLALGLPLSQVFKHILNLTATTLETKRTLLAQDISVNGRRVKDHRRHLAFLNVLRAGKAYRMILTENGKVWAKQVDEKEANTTLVRVNNKTVLKQGKIQLNTNDGNFIVDQDSYRTGDSAIVELPSRKITSVLKMEPGHYAMVMGGQNIGAHGKVLNVFENKILIETPSKEKLTTLKTYAFIVGKDKPEITIQ